MKQPRSYISKNAIPARMIAAFSAVGVVAVLGLTVAMYAAFSGQIKAEIYRGQMERLEQIANTVSAAAIFMTAGRPHRGTSGRRVLPDRGQPHPSHQ